MKLKSIEKSFIGEPPSFIKKKIQLRKMEEAEKEMSERDGDWAVTNIDEIRNQVAVQRTQSGANRPPELYIKDGESKRVRFRDDGPIAGVWQYQVKVNGKWGAFTMPKDGEPNYYQKAGLKPNLKTVFEVIDIDGYVDKTGKHKINIPRFFKVSGRLYEQIDIIRKKRGGLTGYIMEIARRGQSTNTTYLCMPEDPSPVPKDVLKLPRLRAEFRKYYAPLPPEQQKSIVGLMDDDEKDELQPY